MVWEDDKLVRVILAPGESVLLPSGIKMKVPEGHMLQFTNKSGIPFFICTFFYYVKCFIRAHCFSVNSWFCQGKICINYQNNLREAYPCTFKHRIFAYDKNTLKLVKIYANTKECEDDLKVARSNIYNCCNGKQKSCKGYILKYEE